MINPVTPSSVQSYTTPYPHFLINSVFESTDADLLLQWLEQEATWHFHQEGFFEQYESRLTTEVLPPSIESILSTNALLPLRQYLENFLDTKVSEETSISAHKLVPGQGIGIHNDAPNEGSETHRFVLQLNRGFVDENGGYLVVFNSNNSGDIARVIRPVHNTGFGFSMSDSSYHAVTDVRHGERYTIVFSFWSAHSD